MMAQYQPHDPMRQPYSPCRSTTSSSRSSMDSSRQKLTPEADSSPDRSPMPATSNRFDNLQIISNTSPTSESNMQRSTSSLKRPATDEPLDRGCNGTESPGKDAVHLNSNQRSPSYPNCPPHHKYQKHEYCKDRESQDSYAEMKLYPEITIADGQDSGVVLESQHSIGTYRDSIGDADSQLIPEHSLHLVGKNRWAIELQPEFTPISQEQLGAEVKGIYAGLVMVEAKCINIDTQKASDPEERLSTEQWQALVALHRTLLYEHHDFLMATQHPSANPALLGLATKYSMPARMWKHGIHAFLEVLRHRRPESQEYMLAFIYLAYQMISLLPEAVPKFTDTWIECLGDLARYRMAIEDDREIHTIWGGVAGRWYAMATDRHPVVGRLYHHSGILERPSLRKFYLFARALTSVIPFLNARESLGTLCTPALSDANRTGSQTTEASLVCFHAQAFTSKDDMEPVARDGSHALKKLIDQPDQKFACYGVPLAITNIAAVLGYGSADNLIRHFFDFALNKEILASRPSKQRGVTPTLQPIGVPTLLRLGSALSPAVDFCYQSFNTIVRRAPGKDSLQCLLPFAHTMLVFFSSIETLRAHLRTPPTNTKNTKSNSPQNMLDTLLSSKLDFSALSAFLNHTASAYPITAHLEAFADTATFPTDGRPLLEDYMMRGLVWAQWYFGPKWFDRSEDDDGSRALESVASRKKEHRAARVLYLGMTLAQKSKFLSYDRKAKIFSDVAPATAAPNIEDVKSSATAATGKPRRSSVHSDDRSTVSGDYVVVPRSSPVHE